MIILYLNDQIYRTTGKPDSQRCGEGDETSENLCLQWRENCRALRWGERSISSDFCTVNRAATSWQQSQGTINDCKYGTSLYYLMLMLLLYRLLLCLQEKEGNKKWQAKKKKKKKQTSRKREEHNYSVDTAILERQWSACTQRLCVVRFACDYAGHVVHKSVLVWFDSKYWSCDQY